MSKGIFSHVTFQMVVFVVLYFFLRTYVVGTTNPCHAE